MTAGDSNDVAQVLGTACAQTAPVDILCLDSKKVCQGRFRHFSGGLLTVELLGKPAEKVVRPLALCAFVFRWGNSAYVFLTLVKEFYEDAAFGTLVVYEPHQLASERRSAVRVPIYPDRAPLVRVRKDGEGSWTAQAIDISLTGILVEFPADEVAEIAVDTQVRIELKLEETEVDLAGEVRRRDGRRCGIFFSEVLKGQAIEPPDALFKLVRKLERIWLHRRAE